MVWRVRARQREALRMSLSPIDQLLQIGTTALRAVQKETVRLWMG